ncbi:hypothetical protein Glo7428_4793 [Gloeocapsa sp. PCC 7428]|nr:hypothetical protein Glo7428_4793 [Gloeocapsa sp. PCC 7428]
MNNILIAILVLALLLVTIFSPFSALALLMLFLLISAFAGIVWSILRTLIFGEPSKKS